jgi:hypothetical protein
MKKTMILTVVLFCACGTLTALQSEETIISKLDINILSASKKDAEKLVFVFNNLLKIKQTFLLNNYEKDRGFLRLNNAPVFSWLNIICFQKIKLIATYGNKKIDIPFKFEYDGLHFATPCKNCEIELDFFYQPDYFYFTYSGDSDNQGHTVYQIRYMFSSWYFSMPNMKIAKIIWNNFPSNLYFFFKLKAKIH